MTMNTAHGNTTRSIHCGPGVFLVNPHRDQEGNTLVSLVILEEDADTFHRWILKLNLDCEGSSPCVTQIGDCEVVRQKLFPDFPCNYRSEKRTRAESTYFGERDIPVYSDFEVISADDGSLWMRDRTSGKEQMICAPIPGGISQVVFYHSEPDDEARAVHMLFLLNNDGEAYALGDGESCFFDTKMRGTKAPTRIFNRICEPIKRLATDGRGTLYALTRSGRVFARLGSPDHVIEEQYGKLGDINEENIPCVLGPVCTLELTDFLVPKGEHISNIHSTNRNFIAVCESGTSYPCVVNSERGMSLTLHFGDNCGEFLTGGPMFDATDIDADLRMYDPTDEEIEEIHDRDCRCWYTPTNPPENFIKKPAVIGTLYSVCSSLECCLDCAILRDNEGKCSFVTLDGLDFSVANGDNVSYWMKPLSLGFDCIGVCAIPLGSDLTSVLMVSHNFELHEMCISTKLSGDDPEFGPLRQLGTLAPPKRFNHTKRAFF